MITFYDVCNRGDIEEVKNYIKKHNNLNWNYGLYGTCLSGRKEIGLLMISLGADDFDGGLRNSCYYGQKEMVSLMIEKGATDFAMGLYNACLRGHKDIVELLISKGSVFWNNGFCGACSGGHKELAILMLEKGAVIDECIIDENITLNFDDIYYLFLKGVPSSSIGKYKYMYGQCKIFRSSFYDIMSQIFNIEDLAKIAVSF